MQQSFLELLICPQPITNAGILQNTKVHHRVHNTPPLFPTLSQINPLKVPSFSFLKKNFNIIIRSMPRTSTWSTTFRLSRQKYVRHTSHFFVALIIFDHEVFLYAILSRIVIPPHSQVQITSPVSGLEQAQSVLILHVREQASYP